MAQTVKNPPAMQQTRVQSLGWEVPLEKGMATHSSILAWRIPWTEKPGRLQRVRHNWAINIHTYHSVNLKLFWNSFFFLNPGAGEGFKGIREALLKYSERVRYDIILMNWWKAKVQNPFGHSPLSGPGKMTLEPLRRKCSHNVSSFLKKYLHNHVNVNAGY